MLPDHYASPLHLPFNRDSLGATLALESPDGDPGGEKGAWIVLRGSEVLFAEGRDGLTLPEEVPVMPAGTETPSLYIGRFQGRPCRVRRMPRDAAVPPGYRWEDLLSAEPRMSVAQLSLGGMAGQILHWERNSRFCSRCGKETERVAGEWGKKCRGCGYVHYPHIHPCAIVLVQRPGEVLLIRKSIWPEGRYSLVAGFLDFGECLEEAAAREVLEETGVRVKNIRYVGSQSWPFPSQLMAGFTADYAGGGVVVEEKELEDARWFPVDALPVLPPKRSIARYLIDNCIRR